MRPSHGFTLVELSIVLVIIALLAGGVLVGQSLIRNSEIQSVVTEVGQYREATGDFSKKYNALPGDMPDAETYWGSDSSCPSTATNTTAKTATCNGDGDGKIDNGSTNYERFRAWQQLADAGLIAGTYTGVTGTAGSKDSVLGQNVPRSAAKSAGYTIRWLGTVSAGDANYFAGSFGHVITFGTVTVGANQGTIYPAITAEDAASLDQKMDDGLPAYGNVFTWKAGSTYAPSCATTAVESTAAYATSTTGQVCSLSFSFGF
jgi:prepilin-type N-terminal cleavage/methylation domain-containing protein